MTLGCIRDGEYEGRLACIDLSSPTKKYADRRHDSTHVQKEKNEGFFLTGSGIDLHLVAADAGVNGGCSD